MHECYKSLIVRQKHYIIIWTWVIFQKRKFSANQIPIKAHYKLHMRTLEVGF